MPQARGQHERVPVDVADIPRYLDEQFRHVYELLEEVNNVQLTVSHVEPTRPRNGLIALADGQDWNPGSGAGYYGYYSGAWRYLG